jgi:hypothetical protein
MRTFRTAAFSCARLALLAGPANAAKPATRGILPVERGPRECYSVEPEPWYGGNEAELLECVEDGFALLNYVEVTFNGVTTTDLDDFVVTTELDTLPPDNLLGPDSGLTLDKGYYPVISPLSPGRTRCGHMTNSSRWTSRRASRSRSTSTNRLPWPRCRVCPGAEVKNKRRSGHTSSHEHSRESGQGWEPGACSRRRTTRERPANWPGRRPLARR